MGGGWGRDYILLPQSEINSDDLLPALCTLSTLFHHIIYINVKLCIVFIIGIRWNIASCMVTSPRITGLVSQFIERECYFFCLWYITVVYASHDMTLAM